MAKWGQLDWFFHYPGGQPDHHHFHRKKQPYLLYAGDPEHRAGEKEYGAEQAEIIAGICANIICGQVSGDSARKLSETFGKIVQDQQSLSINSSDTSISKSTQMDYAIPASKIATLSAGEFVGLVADSPGEIIPQKMFHAELQNDHQGIAREEKGYVGLPQVA